MKQSLWYYFLSPKSNKKCRGAKLAPLNLVYLLHVWKGAQTIAPLDPMVFINGIKKSTSGVEKIY